MKSVVVAIIDKKIDDVHHFLLVTSNKDFGKFSGMYYPPGGHVDDNETEEAALIREIKEELNLKIKPERKITKTKSDIPNQITHWWSCSLLSEEMNVDNKELSEAGFFTLSEMRNLRLWPATEKFFKKYFNL